MNKRPPVANTFDVVRPFTEALATTPDLPNVQIFGGIGSFALTHDEAIHKPEERRIIVPADIYQSNYRDKKEKNLRDGDFFVLSNVPEDISAVDRLAQETIGDRLRIETFGMKEDTDVDRLIRYGGMMSLSDRYTEPGRRWQTGDGSVRRVLFPFSRYISASMLDTWTLEVDGVFEAPIPHPGTTTLNYLTRSSSGMRPKDAEKLGCITDRLLDSDPSLMEWITEGPGSSQYQFARLLQTLRFANHKLETLEVGKHLKVTPLRPPEIMNFVLRELLAEKKESEVDKIIKAVRLRAKIIAAAEKHPLVVDAWQRFVEPSRKVRSIVHNDRK